MIATRSQTCCTSLSKWLERKTVLPWSAARLRISRRISWMPAALRLAVGSVLGPTGVIGGATATPHQGRWIVAFRGVEDRNAAETYRNVVLSAEPVEGDDDTLWVHELIGAEVFDLTGRSYGPVKAVEANPASDLLVLAGDKLVPLVFVKTKLPGRVVSTRRRACWTTEPPTATRRRR